MLFKFYFMMNVVLFFVIFNYESISLLRVVRPSQADTIFIGDTLRIKWEGASGNPVKIEYSTDYGNKWKFIAEGITEDYYDWEVPYIEIPTIVFRVTTGYIKKPYVCWNIMNAHSNRVLSVQYWKDGRYLLSAGEDKKVKIWDINDRRAIDSIELPQVLKMSDAQFFHNIDTVLVAADNTVYLWDRINSSVVDIFGGSSLFIKQVYSISSHQSQSLMAAGAWDGTLLIYNIISKSIVFSTNSTGNREIYTVNFSAEGDKIIFGDYSGKIYIQEWQNNTSAVILSGHSENFKGRGTVVYSAKEFPGGKYIASCGVDYTVRIWDLSTQSELNKFEGHIFHNRSISISADGKRVLSGSLDSTIRQWDIERGREIDVAVNHNGQVLRVDYSPTADSMVSCGRDSSIKLWKNYENVDEGDTISRILKLRRYLRIPDITAYIGEQVGVPIEYVDDDKYEPELQSRVFDAEIYVEVPNMLLNTVQPSDYIKSGTRKDTVIVKANGISFVDDTLAELISIALLGDVNREEIRIVDFKILNDSLFTIEKVDGSITILPYCIGANKRAITFSKGWTSVTIAPNPSDDKIRVKFYFLEDGYYKSEIFNSRGEIVMEVLDNNFLSGEYEKLLELKGIPAGLYVIKLTGPTQQSSARFIIRK